MEDELFQMEWRQINSSFAYWIAGPSLHQSDQLEEVGRCGQRDSKKACTGREWEVVTCRFPKSQVQEDFW